MIKVKNKYTGKISYFRFLSNDEPGKFWHTPTPFQYAFDLSWKFDYEPVNTTWEEIENAK